MKASLSLDRVTKRFGAQTAVRSVSLCLKPGRFLALIGASGCGKSTTLRLLAGLEAPDEGTVLMDGRDVTGLSAAERNIALMFQSYALYPHLTVFDNIAIPLRLRRLHPVQRLPGMGLVNVRARQVGRQISEEVGRIAELLRLEGLLDRKPGQLSGGQQQRVALARALVRAPAAFLLDEPLSNLDTQLRARTREEIKALHRRTGHAFLLVTHDQADALSMADEVAVMIAGEIAQLAPPAELYERPRTPDVAAFVGGHGMNLFSPGKAAHALHAGTGELIVGVRPDDLEIDRTGTLRAHVTDIAFQGSETLVSLRGPADERITAIVENGGDLPALGADVGLTAWPDRLHLFDARTRQRIEPSRRAGPAIGRAPKAALS